MIISGVATEASRLRDHVHGGTWFASEGEGEAVILIHGVGLDHNMWDQQVVGLRDRFQVVTYDMLGHGQSAHPPEERQLGDFVRQLHQLMMNLNLKRATIVGFSMGGLVAREFAARHPEMISKLVLMNTVFRRSPEQQAAVLARYQAAQSGALEEGIDAAIERWFLPEYADANPDVIGQVRDRLRRNDLHGYLKAYKVFATATDPEETLAIDCPALVMTGELDTGSSPEMARALADAINGAEVEVLPGLRHMAPVEGARQVNRVLTDIIGSDTVPNRKIKT